MKLKRSDFAPRLQRVGQRLPFEKSLKLDCQTSHKTSFLTRFAHDSNVLKMINLKINLATKIIYYEGGGRKEKRQISDTLRPFEPTISDITLDKNDEVFAS